MKNYRAILSMVRDMSKFVDKAYIGVFNDETGEVADMSKCAAAEVLEKALVKLQYLGGRDAARAMRRESDAVWRRWFVQNVVNH